MLRIFSGVAIFLLGNVAATHPHYQCANKAPFKVNDWFEWANCEWTMEHPQKCDHDKPQRMMTCQVVCNEIEPAQPKHQAAKICEQAKIDLTFLVDGSGSVGEDDFQIVREFLRDVSKNLDLASDRTHVNMIQFSKDHNVEILHATNKYELLEAISKMKYHDGTDTRTGAGIQFSNDVVFSNAPRQDATPVFIVITDGKSKDDVAGPIQVVHDMGIETIAVGVGSNFDVQELELIASKPSNVHQADFMSLAKLQEKLTEEICSVVIVKDPVTTVVVPSTQAPTTSSSTTTTTTTRPPFDFIIPGTPACQICEQYYTAAQTVMDAAKLTANPTITYDLANLECTPVADSTCQIINAAFSAAVDVARIGGATIGPFGECTC